MKASQKTKIKALYEEAVCSWYLGDFCAEELEIFDPYGYPSPGGPLDEKEDRESEAHGGEGLAAHIQLYETSVTLNSEPYILSGDSITLRIRFKATASSWGDSPIALRAVDDPFKAVMLLHFEGEEIGVVFLIHTAFRDSPLRLFAPLHDIGSNDWHDATLFIARHRVELYIDGVLADEEWPVGIPETMQAQLMIGGAEDEKKKNPGFDGWIDHVALWNRHLAKEELTLISGGAGAVARREIEFNGPVAPMGQYWTPRGHNASVGDCMPFFDGKRYHFFYLFDRRAHRSKWHLGAHQWAHLSSDDLRRWEEHPMAIPIDDERESSICTGSFYLLDGVYRAFYSTRMNDGTPAPLGIAVSEDGIHFKKTEWAMTLEPPYVGANVRDPHVFRDPTDGRYRMLVTTSVERPGESPKGCLAQLVSDDLERWELTEPFIVPDLPGEPECSEWFEWNGWFYLVISIEGIARYRMSRNPLGPWETPKVDSFDGHLLGVMKSAPFFGNRRIGAAFLRRPSGYAGEAIFRELLQHPDGSLGTRWPDEMIPVASDPIRLYVRMGSEGVTTTASAIRIDAPNSENEAYLSGSLEDFRLTAFMRFDEGTESFGLRFFVINDQKNLVEIWVKPAEGRLEATGGFSLSGLDGLEKGFRLDLLRKGDILDLCIDERRTLAFRIESGEVSGLTLFAERGAAMFEGLEIRTLL